MNELEIAISKAELFLRLGNWSTHCSTFDCGDQEQLEFERLETMTRNLAMSRAQTHKRDFKTALMEVELQVSIHLAKLLEPTIDPALAGTITLSVDAEDGIVCGVCQEEIEKEHEARAIMECMHMFHDFCILKWLEINNTCPLCRAKCKPKKLHFQEIKI